MQKVIIHLISDSSGQAVKYTAKSAISLFPEISVKQYHWLLIRNKRSLDDVIAKIEKKPGIVLYTIADAHLRTILKQFCNKLRIPCISIVGKIVKAISSYVGVGAENVGVRQSQFDDNYFSKMEAIDYTIRHDDGQSMEELNKADVILVGPSRTSKTPTSVYLAYNGFKTANIPYIHDYPFPEQLENMDIPLIVGLIIDPGRLIRIREGRMKLLQIKTADSYMDFRVVQEECLQVKKLCIKNNWPIVDVSYRSIEETATIVMKHYYEKSKIINKK